VWLPFRILNCCVCGYEWPCETKREHLQARTTPPGSTGETGGQR